MTGVDTKGETVDIVLPCHGSDRDMLIQSIGSVISQTHRDWTLTIVDDGNDSGFPDLIRGASEGDPRVRMIRNDRNLGLPVSLERGFMAGSGELVGWTSDDNWYAPDFMAEMVEAFRAGGFGLIRCLETHVLPGGRRWNFDPRRGSSCLPRHKHEGYLGAGHLIRRAVYRAIVEKSGCGWDPEMHGIEDLDMYYKIIEAGEEVGFVGKPLYFYREGTSGFSNSFVASAREKFMRKWGL